MGLHNYIYIYLKKYYQNLYIIKNYNIYIISKIKFFTPKVFKKMQTIDLKNASI
jgi:hypothetical protein